MSWQRIRGGLPCRLLAAGAHLLSLLAAPSLPSAAFRSLRADDLAHCPLSAASCWLPADACCC